MRLRSNAFPDGAAIPPRFTCSGEDVSPPLEWSGVPDETKSFALLCGDPDAPGGTFHHWAAYDIAAALRALPLGAATQAQELGFKQAINDFKRSGYGGPCPPRGAAHHYHFRLIALAVERLELPDPASCRDVERAARRHSLAEAILVGIYRR